MENVIFFTLYDLKHYLLLFIKFSIFLNKMLPSSPAPNLNKINAPIKAKVNSAILITIVKTGAMEAPSPKPLKVRI